MNSILNDMIESDQSWFNMPAPTTTAPGKEEEVPMESKLDTGSSLLRQALISKRKSKILQVIDLFSIKVVL